jgi:ABC-type glutathione transport system ATPase component
VSELTVEYASPRCSIRAARSVTFTVAPGEAVGIVGDSGSGKSTVAMALLGLGSPAARTVAGSVRFDGRDLRTLGPEELRALRGDRIGLVPQDAMHGLDPVMDVHAQVVEVIRAHRPIDQREASRRAGAMLGRVGIADGRQHAYPHELSGGMRQRVVIAMALVNDPVLLVADEPTTGLDEIVRHEITDLLAGLRASYGMAMVIVSHDLPTVMRLADRILVMAGGAIVEAGPTGRVVRAPAHPATVGLVAAVPQLGLAGTL